MGMSRCYSLMKCLLILFNIIFLVVGVGASAFAWWALWEGGAADDSGGNSGAARAGLCALAAWGGALALGAACALAGCARSSASLLAAAFALLALSAVAEGAAAWWGAAHLPQLRHALQERLHLMLEHDYGSLPVRTRLLDAIQQGLECCGVDGAGDWRSSAWSRAQGGEGAGVAGGALDLSVGAAASHYWVPASCCSAGLGAEECLEARRVAAAARGAVGLATGGCGGPVLSALAAGARAPLAAAAALLAAQALSLLLALALCLRAQPDTRYKA